LAASEVLSSRGIAKPHDLVSALDEEGYLLSDRLATALFLSLELARPLLLEGDAGVGKTELALALAHWLGSDLIRLQCYEGIDAAQAMYDWNYSRQLLHLKALEVVRSNTSTDLAELERDLYSEEFLIERPLLAALGGKDRTRPPVLLIDEIDRADDEFEAFLLEVLSTSMITIPEIGPRRAMVAPLTVLTSNRTRELHDALKRRCLYHWVDHPSFDREVAIVQRRVPEASEALAKQVTGAVHALRSHELLKAPGVAETIDWARALVALDADDLTPEVFAGTLGVVIKHRDDEERARGVDLSGLFASGS